jgi:hypothetical protein
MSSSHVQRECEKWILDFWLPEKFRLNFKKKRLKMQGRGEFEFDAVSLDMKIIGNISTASAFTHRRSIGSGKKSKLRADCLMLALCSAEKKLMILTEASMHELAIKEQANGRLPFDIEFHYVELPETLKQKLAISQDEASMENRGTSQPST